jgi:hypothetical protein
VKCWNESIVKSCKKVYVDVVDSDGCLEMISRYPHVKIIAISYAAAHYISARVENDVVVIPEHHCNFDNEQRDATREVKTIGFVGSKFNLDLDVDTLKARLNEVGLDLKVLYCEGRELSRKDVIQFYKDIDIQICFRRPRILNSMPPELKNPLKPINAGSFSIPTVAFPEYNFRELLHDIIIPARNLDDLVFNCMMLSKDKDRYRHYALDSWVEAQNYHIDKISSLYQKLEDVNELN